MNNNRLPQEAFAEAANKAFPTPVIDAHQYNLLTVPEHLKTRKIPVCSLEDLADLLDHPEDLIISKPRELQLKSYDYQNGIVFAQDIELPSGVMIFSIGYQCNACDALWFMQPFGERYKDFGPLSGSSGSKFYCPENHLLYSQSLVRS